MKKWLPSHLGMAALTAIALALLLPLQQKKKKQQRLR